MSNSNQNPMRRRIATPVTRRQLAEKDASATEVTEQSEGDLEPETHIGETGSQVPAVKLTTTPIRKSKPKSTPTCPECNLDDLNLSVGKILRSDIPASLREGFTTSRGVSKSNFRSEQLEIRNRLTISVPTREQLSNLVMKDPFVVMSLILGVIFWALNKFSENGKSISLIGASLAFLALMARAITIRVRTKKKFQVAMSQLETMDYCLRDDVVFGLGFDGNPEEAIEYVLGLPR